MANGRRTVSDIFTRVQRTFGDEANIQVNLEDVIRWINDACSEVVMQHENLLKSTTVVNSVAFEQDINLPEDVYTLNSVSYRATAVTTEPMYALEWKSNQEMDYLFPGWRTTTNHGSNAYPFGTPQYFTRGELSTVGDSPATLSLFPIPDIGYANSVILDYNRYALDVVDVDDAIDLPAYYHGYVEHFCMMKAYEKDEDWNAVDRKAQLVQSTIDFNNTKEQWFGQATYPVVSSEY
jgi:hypothetical protein